MAESLQVERERAATQAFESYDFAGNEVEDGIWRQHTWCLETLPSGEVRVLETITPALAYFGYVMTDDEADAFAVQNV